MKHLKIYENYDFKDLRLLCQKYGIHRKDYKINQDGSIDVDCDVILKGKNLIKIEIKFNIIKGSFDCSHNFLKTLDNSPKYIQSNFSCYNNNLSTFLGGPLEVKNYYLCFNNIIKDVYGFPENFNGKLDISYNPINQILGIVNRENIIRFIYWLNAYQVIRNQNTIIQDRLMEAIHASDMDAFRYYDEHNPNAMEIFKTEKFKNYKLI